MGTLFRGTQLPKQPEAEQLQEIASDYAAIVRSVMEAIVDRYERKPDYGWLNTKINLITGADFPKEDLLRGPGTVYGWIQGRGLEALAGHARWFRDHADEPATIPLRTRMDRPLREVLGRVRKARARNGGHLFFFMTPEGEPFVFDAAGTTQPLTLTAQSPYNFSDLFGAKGMYAAARYLGDEEALSDAKGYCLCVDDAIWRNRFTTDQQPWDPKNPVQPVPGRRSHAPFMIQIGTATLLAEHEKEPASVELGLRLIRHIMGHHLNISRKWPDVAEHDFVEFIDDADQPYVHDDQILSDPGHALEFVGLTLKFTAAVKRQDLPNSPQRAEIASIEALMPNVLRRNFHNGFQEGAGGICKLFDLVTRKPVNTDMPWWSLPETMRAALECWRIAQTNEDQQHCLNVFSACHNAFVAHYVRPELNLMAVQTRNKNGEVLDVIPGTPDADPGYHTGLCLIDCLHTIGASGHCVE